MPFTVIVNENSHYMDESESYTLGEFQTAGEGLAACKQMVDDDLAELHTPGMPAEELYRQYTTFGRDPHIVPADDNSRFSAWVYAKERCPTICNTPPATQTTGVYIEWFKVTFDDAAIHLDVSPPASDPWAARIEWARIVRICFRSGDFPESDDVYIFTDERPESRLIPIDASGGYELWQEVLRRKLFDAELAIRAAASPGGELFCDPDT
jgi:hypothetical protein